MMNTQDSDFLQGQLARADELGKTKYAGYLRRRIGKLSDE
jgi:hypothetical protein